MNNNRFLEWVLFAPTNSATTLRQWLLKAMQTIDDDPEAEVPDVEIIEGARYSAILCYDESIEQEDADIAQTMRQWGDNDIHVVAMHRSEQQYLIYKKNNKVTEEILVGEPAAYDLSEKLDCPLPIWLPQDYREFFQVLFIADITLVEFEKKAGNTYEKLLTPITIHEVSGGVVLRPVYTQDAKGMEMHVSGESVPSIFSATQLFPKHVVALITAKNDWSVFNYCADKGQQEVGIFSLPTFVNDEDEDDDDYPRLEAVNGEIDPKEICASFGISENFLFGKK